MKKTICLCIACALVFSFHGAAQCGSKKTSYTKKSCGSEKSSALKKYTVSQKASATLKSKWVPVIGSSYQLGLWGEENPVAFTAGVEKFVSKHIAVTGDVFFWRTNWESWCDQDVRSVGKYTAVIPSVKFRYDPGKQYKGFFIGAGIGYVVARDKGTEQPFVTDASSGIKNPQSAPTPADWSYNGVAPSFSLGFSFKVHHVPVTVINTNYFAKTTFGFEDIATGVGLNIGLAKVKSQKNKSCRIVQRSCSSSKIIMEKKVKTVSENKAKTGCSKGN